jgi:glutamine transport system substrate-binding protein
MKAVRVLFTALLVLMLCSSPVLAKKLIVGTDTNFMPFEFKQDGKFVGFDIDFWAAIAKDNGWDYELQGIDFNGLIPALQTNNIDVAIAGMTIKSEREKVVDFAYPYYDAGLKLLVQADNNSIKTIEDLKGKQLATKLGTTSADYIKNVIKPGVRAKLFPNIDGAYLELVKGGADAVIFDSPNVLYYARTAGKGKVKPVGPLYEGQPYGIAFPQGSEYREPATISILKFFEDGTYNKIYRKWFGEDPR